MKAKLTLLIITLVLLASISFAQNNQPQKEKQYSLQLTNHDIDIIIQALAELPAKNSYNTISKIQNQTYAQDIIQKQPADTSKKIQTKTKN